MSTFDSEKNKIVPGTLYLVATPIGNLSDLSPRALKVLGGVDFIAAEDTRNTALLLSRFDLKKELISYFEHNKRERGGQIVARLENGESCALVTDAGTPAISDPGEDIVRLCAARGVPVTSVPGCCALIDALSLSAISTARFAFEGFLPANSGERRRRLEEIAHERRTIVFYEAPHKLRTTLSDLLSIFGNRSVSLCRELTKLNEEIMRTTLEDAVVIYKTREPRGEYVIVLEGEDERCGGKYRGEAEDRLLSMTEEDHVAYYMNEKNMPRMDAIKAAAKARNMSKSDLYAILNKNKR